MTAISPRSSIARQPPSRPLAGLVLTALLVLGACGGGSDDASDEPATTTTAAEETTTTEPEPVATSADDLEAILPTAEELGSGFAEIETPESPSFFRLAMADRCPDAAQTTAAPDGAVDRTFEAENGIRISFQLAGGQEPMTAEEERTLIDALNACEFGVRDEETLHSIQWAAGSDEIGDQAIRGAVSDSVSSDEAPEPVGFNTYFARVVVNDVSMLIRGVDGWDGTTRFDFDPDQLGPLVQEMVQRVEALAEG